MMPRIITMLLGIWLMVAPDVLEYGGAARINDRIVGPLIAAMAIISASEVTRPVRWIGIPLAAWLLLAPWVLGYPAGRITIGSTLVAILLVALSFIRGSVHSRFGGGWSSLWRPAPDTANWNRNDHPRRGVEGP